MKAKKNFFFINISYFYFPIKKNKKKKRKRKLEIKESRYQLINNIIIIKKSIIT